MSYNCAACGGAVNYQERAESEAKLDRLDDKSHRLVQKELALGTQGTKESERDSVGNPIVCPRCCARAIAKVRVSS